MAHYDEEFELAAELVKAAIASSQIHINRVETSFDHDGRCTLSTVDIDGDVSGRLTLNYKVQEKLSRFQTLVSKATARETDRIERELKAAKRELDEANRKLMSYKDRMKRLHKLSHVEKDENQKMGRPPY